MTRILDDSSLLGQQSLVVDKAGNGDYRIIQDALNVAALYATLTSRWSVRVAPGTYDETLDLKDYVDLVGLAPGRATRLQRASGAVINTPATCVIANIWLETTDTPVVSLGSGFTGVLELDNIIIDQTALDVQSIQVAGGTLIINRSTLAAGGAFELTGGTLEAHHSVIRQQAIYDGGANMSLYIQHGTLLLTHCLVENVSPAGYAVYIDNTVTSLKALHCTFRKADSTYAIHVDGSARAMVLAACCGNAALHPNLTGYHDYVYDASI